jgi:trk system potassium uptake protein
VTEGNFIVVGCGRVGSTVARRLDSMGHDVVVIDRRKDAFRRLGAGFGGRTLAGVGFDRDMLRSAGISEQSAVMAVTSGDNSNILIARVAREMFGVERVVARITDPRRAAIYERLGIQTVATVSWASKRVFQLVLPQNGEVEWIDPTAQFSLVERRVPKEMAGTRVDEAGAHVALLVRNGQASIPAGSLLLQEGDGVHLLATTAGIAEFDALAGAHGEAHR